MLNLCTAREVCLIVWPNVTGVFASPHFSHFCLRITSSAFSIFLSFVYFSFLAFFILALFDFLANSEKRPSLPILTLPPVLISLPLLRVELVCMRCVKRERSCGSGEGKCLRVVLLQSVLERRVAAREKRGASTLLGQVYFIFLLFVDFVSFGVLVNRVFDNPYLRH